MENSSDNISTWFVNNCSRSDAESLLYGKPDGTFLIRPKINGFHALSIVYNSTIRHCLIYQDPDNRFGFGPGEPHKMFNNLSELVFYYTKNSLVELTLALPTELIHPVNSNLILLEDNHHGQPNYKNLNLL